MKRKYRFMYRYRNRPELGEYTSGQDEVFCKAEADRLTVEKPHPMDSINSDVIYRVVAEEVKE